MNWIKKGDTFTYSDKSGISAIVSNSHIMNYWTWEVIDKHGNIIDDGSEESATESKNKADSVIKSESVTISEKLNMLLKNF